MTDRVLIEDCGETNRSKRTSQGKSPAGDGGQQKVHPEVVGWDQSPGRFSLSPSDGERVGERVGERGSLMEWTSLLTPALSSIQWGRGREHPQLRDARDGRGPCGSNVQRSDSGDFLPLVPSESGGQPHAVQTLRDTHGAIGFAKRLEGARLAAALDVASVPSQALARGIVLRCKSEGIKDPISLSVLLETGVVDRKRELGFQGLVPLTWARPKPNSFPMLTTRPPSKCTSINFELHTSCPCSS